MVDDGFIEDRGGLTRREEIAARLRKFPVKSRKPWARREEFIAAGRPYLEWFNREREDIWPELLDSDGIPICTEYTGAKIGRENIAAGRTSGPNFGDGLPEITQNFSPTMAVPVPRVRCTNVKDSGEQCENWSMMGLSVCFVHGGKTKFAKEQAAEIQDAARQRIFGATETAVDVIVAIMNSKGVPENVRLKAATEILDRGGIKGGVEIDVEVKHKVDAADAVFNNLAKLAANQKKAITSADLEPDDDSGIIDVEIITE